MPPVDVLARRYCATYTYIAWSQPYFKRFNEVQTVNYSSIWSTELLDLPREWGEQAGKAPLGLLR